MNISYIKKLNYPICVKCAHFVLVGKGSINLTTNLVDGGLFGKCKKFGEINNVTGKIIYDNASICRNDGYKCGKKGYFYEEA